MMRILSVCEVFARTLAAYRGAIVICILMAGCAKPPPARQAEAPTPPASPASRWTEPASRPRAASPKTAPSAATEPAAPDLVPIRVADIPSPLEPAALSKQVLLAHVLDEPAGPWDEPIVRLRALGSDAWRAIPLAMSILRNPDNPAGDRAAVLLAEFGDDVMPIVTGTLREEGAPLVARQRVLVLLERLIERDLPSESIAACMNALAAHLEQRAMPEADMLRMLRIVRTAGLARARPSWNVHREIGNLALNETGELRREALRAYAANMTIHGQVLRLLSDMIHPPPALATDAQRADAAADQDVALQVLAMAGTGIESAAPLMAQHLKDPSVRIRARAAYALACAAPGSAEARNGLLDAVRRRDYAVRVVLAPAIRARPTDAQPTLAALQAMAETHADPAVRAEAKATLYQIGKVFPDRPTPSQPAEAN